MLVIDANIWVAAYDPEDRHHGHSIEFLRAASSRREALATPALALIETACAVARRAGSAERGRQAFGLLTTHPMLVIHPFSDSVLAAAVEIGAQQMLRGADAVYAGTAAILGAQLISWDGTLISRSGALSPIEWVELNR